MSPSDKNQHAVPPSPKGSQILDRSTVESLMQTTSQANEKEVLAQLLSTELQHRSLLGESFTKEEYQERFPDCRALIDEVFDDRSTPVAPARYRPVSFHRSGGLGEVWRARDVALNREVALKKLQSQFTDRFDLRRRFLREALITGKLQHPNIVPIHGLELNSADGEPYYTMRFVSGKTLSEEIQEFHSSSEFDDAQLRRLLGMFVSVCHAIGYAHSEGILHRDLKPDNVLVGEFGEIIVLDWGLAKHVGEVNTTQECMEGDDGVLDGQITRAGSYLGTPAYSAPEQNDASSADDLRADVFGLGAILYQILTGKPPRSKEDIERAKAHWEREIVPARQVNPQTAKPLSSIARKALRLDPAARYADVGLLINDVERWLADEPVSAHKDSLVERSTRWLRKHRRFALAAVVTTMLIALVSTAAAFAIDAARQAERERKGELERLLYINNVKQAGFHLRNGNFEVAHELLEKCPEHLRAWEWRYCRSRANQVRAFASFDRDEQDRYIAGIRYKDNGDLLIGTFGENVRTGILTNAEQDVKWSTSKALAGGNVYPIDNTTAFITDHAISSSPSAARVVDLTTEKILYRLPAEFTQLKAVSSDGKHGVFAKTMLSGSLMHYKDGETALLEASGNVWNCDVANGLVVAVADAPDTPPNSFPTAASIHLWRVGNPKPIHTISNVSPRMNVTLSADATLLACQVGPGTMVYDLTQPESPRQMGRIGSGATVLAFTADNKYLASAQDGYVAVWDMATGRRVVDLPDTFRNDIKTLRFSPDGNELAIAGSVLTIWNWKHPSRTRNKLFGVSVEDLQIYKDDLVAVGTDRTWQAGQMASIRNLDLESGKHQDIAPQEERSAFVRIAPSGKSLVSSWRTKIHVIDRRTGDTKHRLQHGDWEADYTTDDAVPNATAIAVSSDDVLASAPTDFSSDSDRLDTTIAPSKFKEQVNDITYYVRVPFGESKAPVYTHIKLWDLESGKQRRDLAGHKHLVTSLEFSRDGKRLVSASLDRTARVWDVSMGKETMVFRDHQARVMSLALHPDGRRVATGDAQGKVLVWEATTGELLLSLSGHSSPVRSLAFSPNGKRLASAESIPNIKMWELEFGEEILVIDTESWQPRCLTFTSEGNLVAAGTIDEVWHWRTPKPSHSFVARTRNASLTSIQRRVRK